MTKYTTQEIGINPNEDGTRKKRYRLVNQGTIPYEVFASRVAHPGSGLTRGTVKNVIEGVIQQLATELGEGHHVQIGGLGTFSAGIGECEVKHTTRRGKGIAPAEKRTYASNIQIDRVHFRVDGELIKAARGHCTLELAHPQTPGKEFSRITTKREERLELLLAYLQKYEFIRIPEYMALTDLKRFVAGKELYAFSHDESTGIYAEGRGPVKVYKLRSTASI